MEKSLSIPPGGSGKLYGIVAVPESCPRGLFNYIKNNEMKRMFDFFISHLFTYPFFFLFFFYSFERLPV